MITLRQNQTEPIAKAIEFFRQKNPKPSLIVLPTAWGKSILTAFVAASRGLRLIMENPWSENTYLKANFILPPAIVDNNRMTRGDYRVKPTAYWFVNCEPTHGATIQLDKLNEKKTHMKSRGGGG